MKNPDTLLAFMAEQNTSRLPSVAPEPEPPPGPVIKGPSVRVFSGQQANALSDVTVDCRQANAVHVEVIVIGTTPSATISVEGWNGSSLLLPDPGASQVAVTADMYFDVIVGAPYVKVRIASIAGTFLLNQGYTVIVTPFVAPAQPAYGRYRTPTHTAVTVTTNSGAALAANSGRRYALFLNDSDTVIYLKLGATAVANQGIRINASGGSYEMSAELGNIYTGAVNAIHGGTGDKVLLVTEGT